MKALIYQGPGTKVLENRPMSEIAEPTDPKVKIEGLSTGRRHSMRGEQ